MPLLMAININLDNFVYYHHMYQNSYNVPGINNKPMSVVPGSSQVIKFKFIRVSLIFNPDHKWIFLILMLI